MAALREEEMREASVSAVLGHFVASLRWEAIPAAAQASATRLVLDMFGVMLAGVSTPPGRRVAEIASRRWPGDEATLLGVGARLSAEGAAFGNATLGKIVGMEDSNRAYGHVASQVVPAALALAEAHGTGGRQLLTAVVAGYEVFARIGREVRKAQIARGFDIKGTVGAVASAAAAGKVWELDGERTGHAIGLASSLAAGLETYTYDPTGDTEWLIAGFAARNGVFAALLADAGFRAPSGSLEGPGGFGEAFGEGFDTQRVLEGLGERFEVEGAGFKPHSGCRHVHQAVDAATAVRRQLEADGGHIDEEAIEAITVATYGHALGAPFRTTMTPDSAGAAGYSLPVATAIGLVFGSFYPEDIERYRDPRVRALVPKMRLAVDPEIEARHPDWNGCVVRVRFRDGHEVIGRLTHARGEPENMLSETEFGDKFRRLASETLSTGQVDALLERLWGLKEVADVREITRLMIPSGK